jgi:glc operon protein GlcG
LKRFCVACGADLILFGQIRGAPPISIELAIGKTRSAALYQESRQTLQGTINAGRPPAITVKETMQGGVSIRIVGIVVGPVGVSGFDTSKDVEIL